MKSLVVLSLVFGSFVAHAVTLEAARGKTEFLAIGRPSAIKVNGTGKGPTGSLAVKKTGSDYVLNGEAIVDLSTFETGIETRDSHMKEKYLETGKFQNAKLTFTDVKIPFEIVENGGEFKVEAPLDLHGLTRPVSVSMKFTAKEADVMAESKFTVKLTDHGIPSPRFTLITIGDEIQVKTETLVSKKSLSEGA